MDGNRQLSQEEMLKIAGHFEAGILELDAFSRELTNTIFDMKEKGSEKDWE